MFLVSLISKGLTGKAADAALGAAHITVNKNSVPNDPQSPFVTSGLRIGTPAITTRGFAESDSSELAGWICDILDELCAMDDPQQIDGLEIIRQVRQKVMAVCKRLPVYS